MLPGPGHHVGGRVDPDGLPGRHHQGQVGGDGPRPAAHVEQALARAQLGEEIALEFSAVRQLWLRSTDSWCPCV